MSTRLKLITKKRRCPDFKKQQGKIKVVYWQEKQMCKVINIFSKGNFKSSSSYHYTYKWWLFQLSFGQAEASKHQELQHVNKTKTPQNKDEGRLSSLVRNVHVVLRLPSLSVPRSAPRSHIRIRTAIKFTYCISIKDFFQRIKRANPKFVLWLMCNFFFNNKTWTTDNYLRCRTSSKDS